MTWNFLKAIAEIYILFCVATSIFFLSQREWLPAETPETLSQISDTSTTSTTSETTEK